PPLPTSDGSMIATRVAVRCELSDAGVPTTATVAPLVTSDNAALTVSMTVVDAVVSIVWVSPRRVVIVITPLLTDFTVPTPPPPRMRISGRGPAGAGPEGAGGGDAGALPASAPSGSTTMSEAAMLPSALRAPRAAMVWPVLMSLTAPLKVLVKPVFVSVTTLVVLVVARRVLVTVKFGPDRLLTVPNAAPRRVLVAGAVDGDEPDPDDAASSDPKAGTPPPVAISVKPK